MILPGLSLVLGGASSGKSLFAEGLIARTQLSRVYIATAQLHDDEMRAKAARHRAQRGPGWRTIEEPLDLAGALGRITPDEVVLVDCATLWLTNHMLAGADPQAVSDDLLLALATCSAPVVVVSNEVGSGIVPATELGRRFQTAQGQLNRQLAGAADLAVLVVAGLPLTLKGVLPA